MKVTVRKGFGSSMLPTIKRGNILHVSPIGYCTYKDVDIGDLVLYWSKGFNSEGKPRFYHRGYVIRSIVGKTRKYALIKGDNRK